MLSIARSILSCTDHQLVFSEDAGSSKGYEAFVLKNVRLEESRATGNGTAGKTPADTATLYILDRYASSQEWGLSDDGRDMFCPGEVQKPEDAGTLYRVSAVLRRKAARSRLNHWEVLGNADKRAV